MKKNTLYTTRNWTVLLSNVKLCFLIGFPVFETFSFRLYFLTFSKGSVQHNRYETLAVDFVTRTEQQELVIFQGFFFGHLRGPGSEWYPVDGIF